MKLTPTLTIKAQDHAIKSVTIFKSSKAEIVRIFSVNLNVSGGYPSLICQSDTYRSIPQAGQNKVQIEGLPSTIDTHTVRVSGLGDARLSDVVCTIGADNEASYAPDGSSELIRLLTVQKKALTQESDMRNREADLLVNYARTLTGQHVTPSNMSTFLQDFVEQGRLNLKAVSNRLPHLVHFLQYFLFLDC